MVEIKGIKAKIPRDFNEFKIERKTIMSKSAFAAAEKIRRAALKVFDPKKKQPSIYLYSIKYRFPESYGSTKHIWRTIKGFVVLAGSANLMRHEDKSIEDEEKIARLI